MSFEQDAVELEADVAETRVSQSTRSKNVHLRLSHLIPAIMEEELWRPERCDDKIVTESVDFTIRSFTLFPVLFD
jgi:hypothetical protein